MIDVNKIFGIAKIVIAKYYHAHPLPSYADGDSRETSGENVSMDEVRLAVVGGGPKAAAIAARAHALNVSLGRSAFIVDIYERKTIGAHWTGRSGYTDGVQTLCTPIERDLGYPYHSTDPGVNQTLFECFSWNSYLQSQGQAFFNWVEGGRLPPTHSDFSDYLSWAVSRSKARVIHGEVVGLSVVNRKWEVVFNGRGKVKKAGPSYDGVVITGPGPALRLPIIRAKKKVFDGQTMWSRLQEVERALAYLDSAKSSKDIAIIGAGGTAAAILAWLSKHGQKNRRITIVSNQPAFFTRGDSVFENRMFNNDVAWLNLPTSVRRESADRLNRGVVWNSVMRELSEIKNIDFQYGKASRIEKKFNHARVFFEGAHKKHGFIDAGVVFDAIGFNAWWWLDLLGPADRDAIGERKRLQNAMDSNLTFRKSVWPHPPLHAPMHASLIGPGHQSLMSLGKMADSILAPYLTLLST
ncbi:SidA/IucD/PvdA family monooxygenase [Xanthomonas citri]|uniref:SidA/IucD/PvdA family monooxygenase n=1 Tax=Xanthomonas citri TaxID=346 RepID=UPI001F2239D6|nr:SidA/IucD/PvdA family monooxygenase [Xanthomonas citri]